MQEDEKAFGSCFRASNFRALREFCADGFLDNTHLQDKTKMKIRQNNQILKIKTKTNMQKEKFILRDKNKN